MQPTFSGYTCQLLTEDMKEVFIVDGKEEREVECQLKDIKRRMDKVASHVSERAFSSYTLCFDFKSVVGGSSFYDHPRMIDERNTTSRRES